MLAFLAAMTFILYLDRSCINQAAPIIQKELGISETQKAIIFNAFALAYAIFEIPAGRWGDRYGSRRILTRIVLWWSFFTALTGAAGGFASLRRDSIPVRGRRGGGLAKLGEDLAGMVSRLVARACAGNRHDGDAARRRGLVHDLAVAD